MGAIPTGPTAATPTEPTATPEASCSGLARLIGTEAVSSFLQTAFGRDAYRTTLDPTEAKALFGWTRLNGALSEHRLAPPRLRLEQAGSDVSARVFKTRRTGRGAVLHDLDLAALNRELRDGATLILDAANELSPALQRLCAALSAEFGCACQTNAYACWGTTQGFDVHWDDHDVFVIQLEGRKRWDLYGATRAAPTRRDHHAEHRRPDAPIEQAMLAPGDVLYLPRGYWHAAVGLGGPTLHLTVGLSRKTGSDFLHWLADHCLSDDDFRIDLPLEQGAAALGDHLAGLLSRIAALDAQDLGLRYRRHCEAGVAQRPQPSFPHIGGPETDFDPEDRIRLADGAARVRSADATGGIVLSWRGTEYTVDADLEAALGHLLAGERLAFRDVVAASSARISPRLQDFLREMLGRGVIVREGPGG